MTFANFAFLHYLVNRVSKNPKGFKRLYKKLTFTISSKQNSYQKSVFTPFRIQTTLWISGWDVLKLGSLKGREKKSRWHSKNLVRLLRARKFCRAWSMPTCFGVHEKELIHASSKFVNISKTETSIFYFCVSVHHSISQIKHQLDATLCRFYFCRVTLHVSGASAHHQEYLKLVRRPLVRVLSLQVSHHISLLGPWFIWQKPPLTEAVKQVSGSGIFISWCTA
jgi:hypothetical protein